MRWRLPLRTRIFPETTGPMIYIAQNILPIFLAALIGLVIGAVWLKLPRRNLPSPGVLLVVFLCEFWLAAILAGALILAPPRAGEWAMALGSAFIIWIGFILPAFAATLRAVGVAWGRVGSVVAHWLVVMLAQAALMQAIGLSGPPAG